MGLLSIGWAEYIKHDPDAATKACHEALEQLGDHPDGWVNHAARRLLGVMAADVGDYAGAFVEYTAALDAARLMGSATDEGQVLARLAWARAQAGSTAVAVELYRSAHQVSRQAGDHATAETARREMALLLA
jgi:hypothetical protein